MNLLQSITLGVVQGITEFLPISSTAHLKIVPALLGWKDPGAPATAVIQLGTVTAVVIYFARDLLSMSGALLGSFRPGGNKNDPKARLAKAVIVGTLPICVAGLALKGVIETTFRSTQVIAVMMIVMAIVLYATDHFIAKRRSEEEITIRDGWIVGFMQAIALIPGSSRSGSTLAGAFMTGLNREAAARFSFLLSIPATALAGLYEMKEFIKPEPPVPGAPPTMVWTTPDLVLASLVAGAVGFASIHWLLKFLRKYPSDVFVIYRILVGGGLLYLLWAGHIPK